MRLSPITLALLPAAVLAQDQKPLTDKLKEWFTKAADFIPASVPSVIPNPVDAGAAKVAEKVVTNVLNSTNFRSVLTAPAATAATKGAPSEVEWLIFITGGNKTCFGVCERAEKAWNTSSALLAVTPNPPHLATIDCDSGVGSLLCSQLSVTPPSIYHFLIPRPYLKGDTPVAARYIHLNHTSVTPAEIQQIHSKQKYLETAPYTGLFHPFDGYLAKFGLDIPVAWVYWGFAKLPSWAPMILISFISRTFMGRRMPQARGQAGAAPAGAAPAPAR